MQAVDPDEQFNQSAVGIAVKYLSIVLWVERAILCSRLLYLLSKGRKIVCTSNLATLEKK